MREMSTPEGGVEAVLAALPMEQQPVAVECVAVVVSGLDSDGDRAWTATYFGDLSKERVVGLLELAKHAVVDWSE